MRVVRIPLSIVLSTVPVVAMGAMTYAPDTGTTARSRGGAFTAAADDPMAIVYNPAGFADQKSRQAYIDVSYIDLNTTFERSTGPSSPYEAVHNEGAPKISPNLVYSQPFGTKGNWHVGAHGGIGVNMKYPEDGAQRFTTIRLEPTQLMYTGGVAWRFNRFVSAGFTAGGMLTENVTRVKTTINNLTSTEPNEDPAYDRAAELDVKDPFTPVAILGVKVTPVESYEIGVSFRPSVTTEMDGTYKSDDGSVDEEVTLKVVLPTILRTGVRKVGQKWDAEIDFVLEDWSGRKEDLIIAKDGSIVGSEEIAIDREGKAAFSVRVGGSYDVKTNIELQAGVIHETAGIPKQRLSVNVFDAPKTGLALGATYKIGERFAVAGNLCYTVLSETSVDDSDVKQRSAFPDNPEALAVTGNGTYSGAYTFAGLSFLAKF